MIFQNNFREVMRLDGSGNLGIGIGDIKFHNVFRDQSFVITDKKTIDNWSYIEIMPRSLVEDWLLDQDSKMFMPAKDGSNIWILSPELTTLLLLKFS